VRIARVSLDGEIHYAVLHDAAPDSGAPEETIVALLAGHPFGDIAPEGTVLPLSAVKLLAPVIPSKVIAIGKNYVDHAAEMGGAPPVSPLLFLKPSTSVIGPDDSIVLPWQSERVDHEAELAVVIGRMCKDVPVEQAFDVVLGFTCANDVTARDLQKVDGQWTRAKGFDTFCPLGPWIETDLVIEDAAITCSVNGAVTQDGNVADLVHDIPALIAFVSSVMTLLPGDVILTGTPAGVGPIVAGDSVSVTVHGIGTLSNPVVDHV
jgi:2-keto-4-pentenoate hydratase/2-oxohepta-3-ene-1,7-dioic acid hydratase in catechol pathway